MSDRMLVQLPADIRARIQSPSAMLDQSFENRTCNRLNVLLEGNLTILSTPEALRGNLEQINDRKNSHVVIKDLSRTGLGIYFHDQLYPLERIQVQLQHRKLTAIVVRCRYLGPKCFEIGAKVISVQSSPK